jgi:hypothetical protein
MKADKDRDYTAPPATKTALTHARQKHVPAKAGMDFSGTILRKSQDLKRERFNLKRLCCSASHRRFVAARLAKFPDQDVAFQPRQMIDEENAVEMIDFMLGDGGGMAFEPFLPHLAFRA